MNTVLLMLICCVVVQRTYSSKSLFDYNINPEYDLIAEESSARYSNYWPNANYYVAPRRRYKHHARDRGHDSYYGKRNHDPPRYRDESEEDDYYDQSYHSPHFHHPHGLPPGQAKKFSQHHGRPYVIPPRFPPPPVYDENFLNPWTLSGTPPPKSYFVQEPPLTTPRPLYKQHFSTATPTVYKSTKMTTTTTTQSPLSSTTTDDQLMFDIDVRFGSDD